MTTVVVSQPMFIPWIGLFEQIQLADIFVHYDDVQIPQGRSFISRVQIKTNTGSAWLSGNIDRKMSGKNINEVMLMKDGVWRSKHLNALKSAYNKAEFHIEMLELAEKIYSYHSNNLSEFNINAVELISDWLGLDVVFMRSSEIGIGGNSSERLASICSGLGASRYITGLGALDYLDHSIFEDKNINVEYMCYEKKTYNQLHGDFLPYVTILDAIANCGTNVSGFVCSNTVSWRKLKNEC